MRDHRGVGGVGLLWSADRVGRSHKRLDAGRWAHVRRRVLERDGWRCCECGRAGRLEVDHRTPLTDGGAVYDPANLQTLCRSCHVRKTAEENRARRPVPPAVQRWRDLVARLM